MVKHDNCDGDDDEEEEAPRREEEENWFPLKMFGGLVLCFSEIWIHTGCAWKIGSKVYEKGQPQADISAECCGYPR